MTRMSDHCMDCGLQEDYCACIYEKHSGFEPQSGVMNGGTTADNNITTISSEREQNVTFQDQLPMYSYKVDSEMDPTRKLQDTSDAALENFFSRPIKIYELEWGTGSTLVGEVRPWTEYFTNPRVINRINNFNLMRATLNIKIVINGNGFHYGRAIASYLPLDLDDTLSLNVALTNGDIVQTSQQPHVYLDPTTSTGGEMVLPFFWYKNYCSIPEAEFQNLGKLFFRSINDLKHANGANDQATISVFAWATDVSLAVLTSRDSEQLEAQMGDEIDEANKTGMISGPATMVQKVSNALSIIPPIKPFAIATSTMAGAVASVARSFGYCRPPVTKNPEPYRPTPISSLALTTVPDTALKLTVDDKQELSVDPRIAGLGSSDPLSIREIAKRESYLTSFDWAIATAPETILWNTRICPVTFAKSTDAFHFPACTVAAMPFKYWTGTMKYRFQIVCSAFHKGRLAIKYDPEYVTSDEYNVNYLHIIDIADKQDFTIEVGNGQDVTLLTNPRPGIETQAEIYSATEYATRSFGNGVLGVYVVNELTTPNSTVNNDIQVNVFVSCGDDFEVFVPDQHFQNFVFKPQMGLEPQSGMEVVPESQNTEEPSAPQQSTSLSLGPAMQDTSMVNMVFTGESITSFRTMLKRYNLWRTETLVGVNDYAEWNGRRSMFPFLRGNVGSPVDQATGPVGYNYVNTILLHWITYAFQGWRGSIRYKILKVGRAENARRMSAYVQRHPEGQTEYSDDKSIYSTPLSNSEGAKSSVITSTDHGVDPTVPLSGVDGMCYTVSHINPNIEFEVPFYSQTRFVPGKTQTWTSGGGPCEGYDFKMFLDATDDLRFDFHVAIGEDFQTYFWTGLPRMYYESQPPTAA